MDYKKEICGLIRHAATIVGGILIAKGTLDSESFHMILGASASIAGTGWSFVNKVAHKKEVHIALSTDPVSGEQTREFCDVNKVWKSSPDVTPTKLKAKAGNVGVGSTATSGKTTPKKRKK